MKQATEEIILHSGDVLHTPSNVVHSGTALEDTLDLDIFLHLVKIGSTERTNISEGSSPC